MKFAVLSDTHYISKEMLLGDGCEAPLLRHQVNKAVFRELAVQTEIDTILITGDLTDDGDEPSHHEFADMLREVKASGKKVYVLTATHDFHFCRAYVMKRGWPVKYRGAPWNRPWFDKEKCDYRRLVTDEFSHLTAEECVPPLVKVCTADDLWEIYREFGRDQAFSVYAPGYSYAVKLDEKLWCLMLNNNFRDVDATEDMSAGYSPDCYRWIKSVMEQAKEQGAFVFACTHHPLVPPVPAYKIGGGSRNMRGPVPCRMLADLGITLVFSGHTHFADIAFGSGSHGETLCNVTTPAPAFLPPAYRIAEIQPEEHRLRLKTVPVKKTADMNVAEDTLKEHYVNEFIAEYRRKAENLPHGIGRIALGMEVRHLYPLCPRVLSAEEYKEIKHMKMFDIVMDLVVNMQCGDGQYTPDTAVYRFMTAFAAAADSIADTQPFADVRKKLCGYSVRQVIEPMLFNNYVPDNDADFIFDRQPEERFDVPELKSHAGDVLMGLVTAAAMLAFSAAPAAAAAAIPALTILKKRKYQKNPPEPEAY